MKSREEKISAIKGLLNGQISMDQLKPPFNCQRLTVNEMYLLLTIMEHPHQCPEFAECLEYYRTLSNARPITEPEKRGYSKQTDAKDYPKIYPGANEMVKQWYDKLNLPIKWAIKE